ncbi:MAG: hypothetical protein V4727_13765 [Verrucomicrobiota bacterium]
MNYLINGDLPAAWGMILAFALLLGLRPIFCAVAALMLTFRKPGKSRLEILEVLCRDRGFWAILATLRSKKTTDDKSN